MKRILATLAMASLTFTMTGCKGDPAEQSVKLMEQMAEVMDKNKDNCDKMGDELAKFMTDNGKKIEELKKSGEGKSKEEQKEMMKKYEDRMKTVMGKVMGAGMACKDNQKVQDAMKKM